MLKRFAMGVLAAGLVTTVACGRSDSSVTKDVNANLAKDSTTESSDVSVDTGKNTVTLNGTVATPAEKTQAVSIARNTKGANDVVNDIVVKRNAVGTSGAVEPKSDSFKDDVQGAAHDVKVKTEKVADKTGEVIADAAITSEVKTQFLARPGVPGLKIDVDTKDGVVTLSGTVKNSAEATKAVSIARKSKGVKRVVNHLHVA
jgi:hyperosmotically inducible protein